jgi:hypothetical protein
MTRIGRLLKYLAILSATAVYAGCTVEPAAVRPPPLTEALEALPGVALVELQYSPGNPRVKVIHLLNWQMFNLEEFAQFYRSQRPELTDLEIYSLFIAEMDELEALQKEQAEFLRSLVRQHGLRHVFLGGLTDGPPKEWDENLSTLRQIDAEELKREAANMTTLIENAAEGSEEKEQMIEARREALQVLRGHQWLLLSVGAPGQLLLSDEKIDVIPVEDDRQLRPDGGIDPFPEGSDERLKRIINLLKQEEGLVVLLIRDRDDFARMVAEAGDGKLELYRLTTKRYQARIDGN